MRGDAGPADPRSAADRSLSTRRASVLVHVAETAAAAQTFPAEALDAVRPRAGRVAAGVVTGAGLGLAVAVLVGAGGVLEGPAVQVAVGVAFAAAVVAGALLYSRGHWAGWLVACWGAVAGGAAAGAWGAAIVAVLVLAGLAWLAGRGDSARDAWWPPLEEMSRSPRAYAGRLTGVQRTPLGGAAASNAWLTAEVPELPGRAWSAPALAIKGFTPEVGDPVTVWTSDTVPEAAVIVALSDQARGSDAR